MHPSWELIVIIQIIVSAVMTMFTRRVSLSVAKVFFGVGVLSYLAVAISGWVYLLAATGGHVNPIASTIWPYLVVQGITIPAAWMIQYKLIHYIGASNAVIATTFNMLATASFGIFFLREPVSLSFALGIICITSGVVLALRLQPDTHHHITVSFTRKLLLTLTGSILYAIGMTSEKIAVDHMGAWQYMGAGWSMQAAGAVLLFILFGRKEWAHVTQRVIHKGLLLGLLTSVAGALYIYAVSLGSLSHTIVATGAKIVIVMLLAAVFLQEHNAPKQRLAALLLSVGGIWLVLN